MSTRPPVTALIIFDGWGIRADSEANAIAAAKTPVMDHLRATQAHSALDASGEAVGLPPGIMGNSEVGHLTIGSGRVIFQDLMRITKAIESGEFASNEVLSGAIKEVAAHGTLHIWGLVSDGAVHSHINHLIALLELTHSLGANRISVHAVLDGRDKPPRSALPFIDRVQEKLRQLGRGRIATISGRYFAMDRDKRWDRTERAWRAISIGDGIAASAAREAIGHAYTAGQSDEFVEPRVIGSAAPIADGDHVICFNFRADRARQLTAALALGEFSGFKRPRVPKVGYVCMTEYDRTFGLPVAFPPQDVRNTLAEVLANAGLENLRVAETEKYAHVTYFLNGGVEKPFPHEERSLIESSKVATYDLDPAMKAAEIAKRAAEAIGSGKYPVVVMNFANPDMVGHTGKFDATVKAVEAADAALGVVIAALEKRGGAALITADHGNAEFMSDPATGQEHTAHTTLPVPLILYDPKFKGKLRDGGTLADVAPTLLGMLGIAAPPEMTGKDLRLVQS
ncbi:MAG TPA: 2,3-bisphosphoglycerate-independent phosphoglycerate mutase [Candidatus Binataceae bacterium]|nr:2,3-bisphosphoglycerate-independent phosphoglycerate mutase [Candidatus Binataceae bacterium]